MTERKRLLLIGVAIVAAPALLYYLWIGIAGPDFISDKAAPFFSIDERVVYIWCCVAGLLTEIFAIWLLNRCVRAPIDVLTIVVTGMGLLSFLVIVFLLVLIVGISRGGAG